MVPTRQKTDFIKWLRSERLIGRKILGGSTAVGGILSIAVFFYGHWADLLPEKFKEASKQPHMRLILGGLIAFHALTCFLLAIATPGLKLNDSSQAGTAGSVITETASRRIQKMMLSLYLSLTFLYSLYAFFAFTGLHEEMQKWGQVFEAVTATLLFYLYVELSELTVAEPTSPKTSQEILVQLSDDASRQRKIFTTVTAILALLSVLSLRYAPDLLFPLRLFIACLSGVTLALVIGRLGSIYINPGPAVLAMLYLYALIQPFAAYFAQPRVAYVAMSLALPLKVLLWLVFCWAFTSGHLWEYVGTVREFLQREAEPAQPETSLSRHDLVSGSGVRPEIYQPLEKRPKSLKKSKRSSL